MFGFGDGKINAEEYVRTIAERSDAIYGQPVHHVPQCLVDMEMVSADLQAFLIHDSTNLAFSAGIAAEQLQDARRPERSSTRRCSRSWTASTTRSSLPRSQVSDR
ncbi:hypothetical protein [Devosia sp. A449]